MSKRGFRERLAAGETIVIAEGYLFEFERRGYVRAGCFVPEVVLEFPEQLRALHEEFVHAGSDVVEAYTYYGHRAKLRVVGREDELETLNFKALDIAKEVADKHGKLLAGGISNTTIFNRHDPKTIEEARSIFKEQIEWAVTRDVDFIIGETFPDFAEALLALECIKEYGKVPAVITFCSTETNMTHDGVPIPEACRKLEEAGADVVGVNCSRGPVTMMPLVKEIKKVCKGPVAMLPVVYSTTDKEPTMQALTIPGKGKPAFPVDLPGVACTRTEIKEFAEEAKALGIQYIGLCCGNASHYMRILADVYGKDPPANKFSPNMDQHYSFGDDKHRNDYYNDLFETKLKDNKAK
ncbi:betaine--homocysteine S-methyltransferase 1-like [Mytilus galloprovincialis]|uniref:Betaine-homocysteine S-methyltransferase n=1 Tax=Mytilus galloprovincialis TaxID=29158 RepID=A0A8B6DUV6_MYTGA|nr:betaine-homocysteine S-methyltransferase [Mytilus galloprovincialis]